MPGVTDTNIYDMYGFDTTTTPEATNERTPACAAIAVARNGIVRDDQLDDGGVGQHDHGLQQHYRERPAAHAIGGWNTTTAPLGIMWATMAEPPSACRRRPYT